MNTRLNSIWDGWRQLSLVCDWHFCYIRILRLSIKMIWHHTGGSRSCPHFLNIATRCSRMGGHFWSLWRWHFCMSTIFASYASRDGVSSPTSIYCTGFDSRGVVVDFAHLHHGGSARPGQWWAWRNILIQSMRRGEERGKDLCSRSTSGFP